MNALETINTIIKEKVLLESELKYCLVDNNKIPFDVHNNRARPNHIEDFTNINTLLTSNTLNNYKGIGISIQGSNVSAIDVDHCFSIPFNYESIDERGIDVLSMFIDLTYCEFSFSGTGLRILLKNDIIEDEHYYIKNSNQQIEFYQPNKSYRYVTITGRTLNHKTINFVNKGTLVEFMDKYLRHNLTLLKKETPIYNCSTNSTTINAKLKFLYLKNPLFQDLWFSNAPGSGKDESERDYQIISYLYENVTQDKNTLKELFESSPYFKSKDKKHINKWEYNNFRYFEYIWNHL